MNEINNIADTTGRAAYKTAPTKICPCMEQLYFELEDKEHVFQIEIKTILECILFAAKENRCQISHFRGIQKFAADMGYRCQNCLEKINERFCII